ncbi:hypothetical protein U1Q18_016280 [Sarracenia purpurea var. burkii]
MNQGRREKRRARAWSSTSRRQPDPQLVEQRAAEALTEDQNSLTAKLIVFQTSETLYRGAIDQQKPYTGASSADTLGSTNESGCESQGQEVQSSNPPRTGISKASDGLDAEKSSDVQIEGQTLVSPTPVGGVVMDAGKANSVLSVLNRTKKRKLKQNVKIP